MVEQQTPEQIRPWLSQLQPRTEPQPTVQPDPDHDCPFVRDGIYAHCPQQYNWND